MTEHLLPALGAVGPSVVASTDDLGAAACAPASEGDSVQYPVSSPWVTAVGGTTLATGGGASKVFARPPYQSGS